MDSEDPQRSYRDLQALVKDLNLHDVDYSPYVTNKIVINGAFIRGKFCRNWIQVADREFPKQTGWKEAIAKQRAGGRVVFSNRRNPLDADINSVSGLALHCGGVPN